MSYYVIPPGIWDIIGIPNTQVSFNVVTCISYVLPPMLLYFTMAVLVITPQTRALRVAIWPIVAFLAFRAVISVDVTLSNLERNFHSDMINPMSIIVARSLYWALAEEPLVRQLRPVNSTPSTLMDAIDLSLVSRGHGWNWIHGSFIPRETRPSNRIGFLFHVALSAAVHAFICGTSYRALRSFSPAGLGSITRVSIFDHTLPPLLRYLRSSIISTLGCLTVYGLLQMTYDLSTIVGILFLRQDPAQWPPCFNSPWRSTSLAQFWGRRWHQFLRHIFLVQGGYPLYFLFGRTGLIAGAFLSSAVYHHIGLRALDSTSEFWRMLVGFGMMALGIIAEETFQRMTAKKVCGLVGWIWTMTWLVLWGSVIMDGFVRVGFFRSEPYIDGVPHALRMLVERLAMDFDAWLHSV